MKAFWGAAAFFVGSLFANSMSMGVVTVLHDQFQRPPLPDMGHKALPDMWIGQYTLLTALVGAWIVGCVLALYGHEHAYSIYVRALINLGVLMLMRSFSIVVTIQPSPYGHLPPPPSSPWYYALDYRNLFTSLGDNMFSAHTTFLSIPYLALTTFVFVALSWRHLVFTGIYGFLVFWIVASHLHYTADVLLALYLSFSTWCALPVPVPLKKEKTMDDMLGVTNVIGHHKKTLLV